MSTIYWVGGAGNWNDNAHWSYASGGSNGAQIPDERNIVKFDANSGFTVGNNTVNFDGTAYPSGATQQCKGMDWTGAPNNPSVTGSSSADLRVYGDFKAISGMTWSHTGNFFPDSANGDSLFTSGGVSFACPIYFTGEGGHKITLQDNLTSTNTVYAPLGTFDTNNKAIVCAGFNSSGTGVRTITLGSSAITCSGNWDCSTTTNLTVTSNTATITMTGNNTYFHGGGKTWYNIVV
jgi:hypothetical protein